MIILDDHAIEVIVSIHFDFASVLSHDIATYDTHSFFTLPQLSYCLGIHRTLHDWVDN